MRGESVELRERDARTRIRELKKRVNDLEAHNALLTTQLAQANEHISTLQAKKKAQENQARFERETS